MENVFNERCTILRWCNYFKDKWQQHCGKKTLENNFFPVSHTCKKLLTTKKDHFEIHFLCDVCKEYLFLWFQINCIAHETIFYNHRLSF